mmetsp:Transcript_54926/g.61381  ORF Transcript_54926/g.61381 Transcript_54926/m.61381 type:complete len:169 (-) Transcript_54926:433-939(-)|eukprot:CAMPEP_0170784228 /NCGR_PEP_ID=MMETSP0733-20121128/16041_1 /TAXON_ID=186038 /ORGANISM="Fragilariopsis kerguelensis, Strain L26-C5" /LENGTH=168 /DNA_ID=CAMNT_0011129161 /DNA_START=73 /DNA_END=579 /DNA_ORIENTATION=+
MSLAENAEDLDANQLNFYRVLSSEPVIDSNELFDYMSKFLMKDKKQQLSTKFLDEKDQTALRLSWNDLRNISNSVLNEDYAQRYPIPAWVEQKEVVSIDINDDNNRIPQLNIADDAGEPFKKKNESNEDELQRNKIKKAKKKAKKLAKKEKKIKKEAKKRKRVQSDDE